MIRRGARGRDNVGNDYSRGRSREPIYRGTSNQLPPAWLPRKMQRLSRGRRGMRDREPSCSGLEKPDWAIPQGQGLRALQGSSGRGVRGVCQRKGPPSVQAPLRPFCEGSWHSVLWRAWPVRPSRCFISRPSRHPLRWEDEIVQTAREALAPFPHGFGT